MSPSPQPRPTPETPEPISLQGHAMDNISFIRATMINSTSFTGVPGWGMAGMGVLALVGGWIATQGTGYDWWVNVWGVVAVAGCSLGCIAMIVKSKRRRTPVIYGPGRKFLLNFIPPILAGCVLSEIFYEQHLDHIMPGAWLLLYGAAVINGGAFSIALVPIMGVCFMVLGLVVFFLPDTTLVAYGFVHYHDIVLALGFGGLHIVFGVIIALRHGG